MSKAKTLYVYYKDYKVGTLAKIDNSRIAFQYDGEWIKNGFSISPFSLPLKDEVFISSKPYFKGLYGVFADSLPDAWGNILLNRMLKKHGINPNEIDVLDRLAIVGNSGMGALTYRPEINLDTSVEELDLDTLAKECKEVLMNESSQDLDTLFKLGGSSGGARPKILTKINDEDWIIKFPAHTDSFNIGKMEYDYYLCALECGINMTECQLFPSKVYDGYFGTKRFDRIGDSKKHMVSVSALLEVDFRIPSLDYLELMKLTKIITKNNTKDIEQMFRLACFNVFAHNRDDHSKNFSFIFDEDTKRWHISPAYDMTYSHTYYGEHTTTVCNNGINPGKSDLLKLGVKSGMKKEICEMIIEEIDNKVKNNLYAYLKE